MELMPLNNFGIVTDSIYRSGQPDKDGLSVAQRFGITAVLKLNGPDYGEIVACNDLALRLEYEPLQVIESVAETKRLAWILNELSNTNKVLVHCTHGRDRTGLVVGAWRLIHGGWNLDQVSEERKLYGVAGFAELLNVDIDFVLSEIWKEKQAA